VNSQIFTLFHEIFFITGMDGKQSQKMPLISWAFSQKIFRTQNNPCYQAWVIVPIIIDFQLKSITIIMAMEIPFYVFLLFENNGNCNWLVA
jgi:hypothetical protein